MTNCYIPENVLIQISHLPHRTIAACSSERPIAVSTCIFTSVTHRWCCLRAGIVCTKTKNTAARLHRERFLWLAAQCERNHVIRRCKYHLSHFG